MAAASGSGGDGDAIVVNSYSAGPSDVAVTDGLEVKIGFEAKSKMDHAYWSFSYTVDSIKKRYTVLLGSTEPKSIEAGDQTVDFSCEKIDTTGIKPSRLANAGVLRAELKKAKAGPEKSDEDEIVANVNAVV